MKKGWNRMLMVLCVIMLMTAGEAIGAPFQGSLLAEGSGDSYWTFGSTGTAVITMADEVAAFADQNQLWLFSGDKSMQLFAGSNAVPDQITINLADVTNQLGSSEFGFYLVSPQGTFYSDSSLNADQTDHMLAYNDNGEMYFGFEDLFGGGDKDYDDLVIRVDGLVADSTQPAPVPEPATLLLLGSGLLGLASCRKGKKA